MSTLFFSFGFLFIVGELTVLLNPKFSGTFMYLIFQFAYSIWAITGVFTSCWEQFAILLALGVCSAFFISAFTTKNAEDDIYRRQITMIDSIVSIGILLWILITKFSN